MLRAVRHSGAAAAVRIRGVVPRVRRRRPEVRLRHSRPGPSRAAAGARRGRCSGIRNQLGSQLAIAQPTTPRLQASGPQPDRETPPRSGGRQCRQPTVGSGPLPGSRRPPDPARAGPVLSLRVVIGPPRPRGADQTRRAHQPGNLSRPCRSPAARSPA